MKKYLFAVLLLSTLAFAEVSQQEAGIICNPYSFEGETLQITGPITCETQYWTCEFVYYGNEQNVIVAIEKNTGAVLSNEDEILEDILSAKYAVDSGAAYLFETFLTDSTFVIDMNSMNSTLLNYNNVIKDLRDTNKIEYDLYLEFKGKIENVQELSSKLSDESRDLINLSEEFWDSPDCVELLSYLDEFNQTLGLAENFSVSWNDFINRYNALAESVDAYIVAINPSNAQIMQQGIQTIRTGLVDYYKDEEEYKTTVVGNLDSRFDRKDAKDDLDAAYDIVQGSTNQDAISKYNEASKAFSDSDYSKTRKLSAEAITLAGIVVPEDGGPEVIIRDAPDYTPYIILVVLLLVAILFISFKNRKEDVEEEEKEEKEKPSKKSSWGWTPKKESAMERKASKGGLDS